MKQVLAVLLLLSFLVSGLSGVKVSLAAPQTASLQIDSLLTRIPADGNSYDVVIVSLIGGGGKPLISTSTFEVLLTSSNVGVGTVPDNVTFPSGRTFVLVSFQTTATPGSTSLTASAQGVESASTLVQTALPGGFPTAIQMFAAPSKAVAQPAHIGRIIAQLVDSRGNPAQASDDITVTLTSSNTLVASSAHSSVTIQKGEVVVFDEFQTGLVVGTTTITASATGLESDSATVTVVGSTPSRLRAAFSTNPAPPDTNQTLAIWLLDQSGNPTQAPTDITVDLSNSNTAVVSLPNSIVVRAGTSYVDVSARTGSVDGSAEITVTSFNMTSVVVGLDVETPSLMPGELGLRLNFAPSTVIANGQAFNAVFVNLLRNGQPFVANAPVNVSLVSDDYAVLGINRSVLILAGNSYATATLQASFLAGSVQITATATDLTSDQKRISAFGQLPSRLTVVATPSTLPATGESVVALGVGVASSSGQPVIAPFNITVNLVSSNPAAVPINTTVTIPAGRSSILAALKTTTTPGIATITVSGSGYAATEATVTTVVPGASGLRISVNPQPGLQTPLNPAAMLSLQLVDGSGNPVQTTVPVHVTVTASNETILLAPISLDFGEGTDMKLVPLQVEAAGTVELTATGPALLSDSVTARFLPYPLVASIKGPGPFVPVNQSVSVTLSASVQETPLVGAAVMWNSSIGSMNPQSMATNVNGTATSRFLSPSLGSGNIEALLLIPGWRPVSLTYHVDVVSSTTTTTTTDVGGFLGIDLNTLAAAVAAIVAVLLAVGVALSYSRRKRLDRFGSGTARRIYGSGPVLSDTFVD